MGQNARLGGLTDELVQSILNFDPATNRQAYKHAKDIATKGLKAHQYARTNQFDVQASYSGLDEKFRVLGRDDLADALHERLSEIQNKNDKFMPEHLSLLLQLSDRPVNNTRLEALELLRPPPSPPTLTWHEIIADDPYSDDEIWKDIDYGEESSENELLSNKREQSKKTPISSVEDDTYSPESCIVTVDKEAVAEIQKAQFWTLDIGEDGERITITELEAVRETLFMLCGLETSLYMNDKQNNSIRVNHTYTISHSMNRTLDHLLSQLAEIGRKLYRLRQWIRRPSTLPLIQTFEAVVGLKLDEYDRTLAALQSRYLVPTAPVSVSLLELHEEIRTTTKPLLRLAELVAEIEPLLLVNPFAHLEALYDQIGLAQVTLEKDVFDFMSKIFFQCLQTYLKPIRRWMESGELGANDETFFVFENDSATEAASLWHDRFVLRRGQANALRSPRFFEPAAQKIFNTGKSVVFLKELGIYGTGLSAPEPEPRLDHASVCGQSSEVPLSPFSELFAASFREWIRSKYSFASTVLREHLFSRYGLMTIIHNFNLIHLGSNGASFQEFADALFERMDSGERGWNDRFLVTELARGIFASTLTRSEVERVTVRSARKKGNDRSIKGLSGISIDYALSWPILNIIQRSTIPAYQQLFTFLLQVYRAKYLIQRINWRNIHQLPNVGSKELSKKLRHRLLWFADVLRFYLTETVIAPSMANMSRAILDAEDIDEMSAVHIKYMARLQDQALLSDNLKPIHKAIISVLDLAVSLAGIFTEEAETKEPRSPGNRGSRRKRKSAVPALVEDDSSDAESVEDGDQGRDKSSSAIRASSLDGLRSIDAQFDTQLAFVTAGLRSVGRVAAEPVWEMLAERLEWDKAKDRVLVNI
ncbi:hypothetical protein EJ04DRAFT_554437 [Polyplosphaeria fusca]|uniref:Spindle pole body component n=1 Tax=Polyplosphaeria fusca TaxID=682080 RepID=A0A9P4QV59_9PLEO|nr:hypothetical protein EJ04DRAFT_554437 [Polyplosphaeria fusca]